MSVVQFMVDEAASLGRMEQIEDMIAIGRGYGLRLTLIYQSLGQLKKCFPEGQDQTVLSNVTSIFFAVNDNTTADWVSNRIGEGTIIVESGGSSGGSSISTSQGAQPSTSRSSSTNTDEKWQPQARKILKPEEIMVLPSRTAITFAPNVRPVCTHLLRYYEEKHLGRGHGWFAEVAAKCVTLAASFVFAAIASLAAVSLVQAFNNQAEQKYVMPIEIHHRVERIGR